MVMSRLTFSCKTADVLLKKRYILSRDIKCHRTRDRTSKTLPAVRDGCAALLGNYWKLIGFVMPFSLSASFLSF